MATKKPKNSIGKLDDFRDKETGNVDYNALPAGSHICGKCSYIFETEAHYGSHVCDTGFKADSIEHQDALTDGGYSKVSENAQKRGKDE